MPQRLPLGARLPTNMDPALRQSLSDVFEVLTKQLNRGAAVGLKTITTGAVAEEDVTLVDASASAVTVDLPPVLDWRDRPLVVKKIDSGSNAVTIDGNASETIDGSVTYSLASQFDSAILYSDGSEWHVAGVTGATSGWQLIETRDVTGLGVQEFALTNGKDSKHKVVVKQAFSTTNEGFLVIQFSDDGGSTYDTTNNYARLERGVIASSGAFTSSTSTTSQRAFDLDSQSSNTSQRGMHWEAEIHIFSTLATYFEGNAHVQKDPPGGERKNGSFHTYCGSANHDYCRLKFVDSGGTDRNFAGDDAVIEIWRHDG